MVLDEKVSSVSNVPTTHKESPPTPLILTLVSMILSRKVSGMHAKFKSEACAPLSIKHAIGFLLKSVLQWTYDAMFWLLSILSTFLMSNCESENPGIGSENPGGCCSGVESFHLCYSCSFCNLCCCRSFLHDNRCYSYSGVCSDFQSTHQNVYCKAYKIAVYGLYHRNNDKLKLPYRYVGE